MPPAPPVSCPEPGLRLVRAPNPGPMTADGTNTYVLGEGDVVVIDPGPALPDHLTAILAALAPGERVRAVLVTHAHLDHSALAPALARATAAPVFAFGDARAGRSPAMAALAEGGEIGGGEGIDDGFAPDERLADGQRLDFGDLRIEALHTPGHMGNHICLAWNGAVFCGDHVFGWAPTFISPPDGDLTDFMASTRRLAARGDRVLYPGHGASITAPAERLDWLLAHRMAREAQVVAALERGSRTIDALLPVVYADTDPRMHPAARRNLLAHLIDLQRQNRVRATPAPGLQAVWTLL